MIQALKKQVHYLVMAGLAIFVGILFSNTSFASLPVNTVDESSLKRIQANFEYFEDKTKEYRFETVKDLPDEYWNKVSEGNASFGFNDSQFWLRLNVKNAGRNTKNMALELAYTLLDDVTFYALKKDGSFRSIDIGDTKPFYPRDIDHPNLLFSFQLHPNEEANLFARVQTKGSMILPVNLWQESQFFKFSAKEQKFHFFYYGCLSVIILINLAIFFTLREKLYLFYSLSTTGYLFYFLTFRGYSQQILFPDSPWVSSQLFLSSLPFLALFSLLFAREFLKTAQHSPKMDMIIRGMIYFEYFNMVAAVVFDYNIAVKISAVSAIVFFLILFFAGPVAWHAKRRAGVFFTVAWIPLTLGVAAAAGRYSGHLPNIFLTEYAMQIGSGLEAFILTLALADRLYWEREEKILAQEESIQTEKKRLETQSQLSEAMMRDPVTQLANRNRFEWLANKLFDEEPNGRFIICVARVTRVNEITRTLGLSSLERILSTIATSLNQAVSDLPGVVSTKSSQGMPDAIFQLTGDTFGLLVRQGISEKNLEVYYAFTKKIALPIEIDSLSVELDPRVGSALYPAHGVNAAQLIRNALVAMESAHHASDQVGYYNADLDIYNESRLTLMSDLREALNKDEPVLYYQPKQDLKNGDIIGLEALIRWKHPHRGFVSPVEFIPLAEQAGVIQQLTLWAVERAAKDLLTLRKTGYTGNMSVNISAKDLLSKSFTQQISSILNKYQVDPSMLFLELTETAAMDEPETGLKALEQLTSLGLKVSIDDFGVGYSSLSYLKQLPVSEIKLDRSLVKDITHSESSRLIVKMSIDMAHGLGYMVVAEGVEDLETCHMLKDMGCDKLQGFWLCKPKSLNEIGEWLKAR